MLLIIELYRYYVDSNFAKILTFFADDIHWHISHEINLHGLNDVERYLVSKEIQPAAILTLKYVLTHGKLAAVNGEISYKGKTVRFSDFYEFSSASSKAKIKKITSTSH
ncbi:MAG: nuclear transport factor 2 family protein [Sphingobacterium sp.]|nr:hypothetical protein FM107_17005 [Sphingobacterium sp. JB170]